MSLVRYRGNDYLVPAEHGHRGVWVMSYMYEVMIGCSTKVIGGIGAIIHGIYAV
jgi:hypothetical protein